MIGEELAEEYIEKNCKIWEEGELTVDEIVRLSFLAGLKAGRPQWHKVADGDLPPLNTNVLVIHRWARTPEVGKRIEVFINSSVWVWAMCSDRYRYTGDDENVIAWCEIPTFDKE